MCVPMQCIEACLNQNQVLGTAWRLHSKRIIDKKMDNVADDEPPNGILVHNQCIHANEMLTRRAKELKNRAGVIGVSLA